MQETENENNLQWHTIEMSPRFKCITMWRIIYETGCTKREALKQMLPSDEKQPFAGCYACEDSSTNCIKCPITWPTKDGSCIDLHDDILYATSPEEFQQIAIPILDACASWVPDPTEPEVFLPVQGYKGIYEVSNLGRVRSLSRIAHSNDQVRHLRERILKPTLSSKGRHLTCNLYKEGLRTNKAVHHLVWEAHIGTPINRQYNILFREGNSPALHNLYRVKRSYRACSKMNTNQ